MKFNERRCVTCFGAYVPTSGHQSYCPSCSTTLPECECGGKVSGPQRWGRMWGGECDRAELRASMLLDRLAA